MHAPLLRDLLGLLHHRRMRCSRLEQRKVPLGYWKFLVAPREHLRVVDRRTDTLDMGFQVLGEVRVPAFEILELRRR